MEEADEEVEEEEMEQDHTVSVKSAPDVSDKDETTLLAQESGEENQEDKEDVEEKIQEELLKEEVETTNREEVIAKEDKEVDEVVMEEEQRCGEEVNAFLDVKDQTDPLNVQQNNFSSLAINSPKDINMSDTVATDHNDNSKAEAKASLVAKASHGSNNSHQAEALHANHAPAADVYRRDKEKQGTDSESEEEVEDERVEGEGADEEVRFVEEVNSKSEKEEMKEVANKGCRTGAFRMGATDQRIVKVKAQV